MQCNCFAFSRVGKNIEALMVTLALVTLLSAMSAAAARLAPGYSYDEMSSPSARRSLLVVNGEDANVADYPFYGSLRIPKSEEAMLANVMSKAALGSFSPPSTDTAHNCGVSLVHPNIAVTAAHCVYDDALGGPIAPFLMTVAFNSNSYFAKDYLDAEIIQVAAVEIHPEYQPIIDPDMMVYSQYANDLAILVLERASEKGAVIPFATSDNDAMLGESAETIGWGNIIQAPVDIHRAQQAPKKLQHAEFQVISNEKCEAFMHFVDERTSSSAADALHNVRAEMVEALKDTPDLQLFVDKQLSSGISRVAQAIDDDMYERMSRTIVGESKICVDDPSPEHFSGVCSGDSGGPLFVQRDGKPLLVGAASYVVGCGAGVPDTFSRISSWAEHIAETIELLGVTNEGTTVTPTPTP